MEAEPIYITKYEEKVLVKDDKSEGVYRHVVYNKKTYKSGLNEGSILGLYKSLKRKFDDYYKLYSGEAIIKIGFKLSNGVAVKLRNYGNDAPIEKIYNGSTLLDIDLIDVFGLRDVYNNKFKNIFRKLSNGTFEELCETITKKRINHRPVMDIGMGISVHSNDGSKVCEKAYLDSLEFKSGELYVNLSLTYTDDKVENKSMKMLDSFNLDSIKHYLSNVKSNADELGYSVTIRYDTLLAIVAEELLFNN